MSDPAGRTVSGVGHVTVRYWAAARAAAGVDAEPVPVEEGATLADVVERAPNLEMAYNPNDCVELRWGALAKSDEASTCKRYAPAAQREKMSKYRAWFHDRRRPPRA